METSLRSLCVAALLPLLILVAGACFATGTTKPYVDEQIDPARSFWTEYVHYPYPVHYARAADSQGITWQVAYMDEYAGAPADKAKARTLVLIHGRGTNAGTWCELMQSALARGLRVIALDIPHYGKSIPGNVDKPLTRSLDDVREVFHSVIVDQLQVKRATYLGHSLGGQVVFGYALKYPEAVERIIAVAPGGLEEYSASILFDRFYERDLSRWEKTWQPIGMLSREFSRAPYTIEPDYYFNGDGRNFGYFYKDGLVPRFITDIRIKMISANEKEYRNYITSYVHDAYTVGVEVRKDDPQNLNRRLAALKMPILLLMGERDPFFPLKNLSGNSDLKLDMIKPFFSRLSARSNPPQVKIYRGAGHFPFTDNLPEFSVDVFTFIDGKAVQGSEDVAAYRNTVLRAIGLQRFMNNLMQDLVWSCFSKI